MLFSRSLQFYHLIPLLVGLAYSPTTQAAPISVDGSLLTQVSRLEIRTPNGDVVVKGSATPSPQVPHREVPDRRASLGSLSELSSLPLPQQSPVQSPPRRSSEGGGLGGLTNVLQSLTISGQGSSMSEHPAKPSTPNTNGQGSNGIADRPSPLNLGFGNSLSDDVLMSSPVSGSNLPIPSPPEGSSGKKRGRTAMEELEDEADLHTASAPPRPVKKLRTASIVPLPPVSPRPN